MSSVALAYTNFYNGDENIQVIPRIVPQNTTIVAGEIVDKGVNVGEVAKASGTPGNLYGIALEDVTTVAGQTASVATLVSGSFNSDKVVYPVGKGIADYEIPLRAQSIILINVVNTELSK